MEAAERAAATLRDSLGEFIASVRVRTDWSSRPSNSVLDQGGSLASEAFDFAAKGGVFHPSLEGPAGDLGAIGASGDRGGAGQVGEGAELAGETGCWTRGHPFLSSRVCVRRAAGLQTMVARRAPLLQRHDVI